MLARLAKTLLFSARFNRMLEGAERALPPLRYWHRAQYQRHFHKLYKWERLFSGVYPDFASARSAIPTDRPVGYDNPESAISLGRETPMLPSEYPVIFWLSRLLPTNNTVLDLGGYLGFSYDWYRKYAIYPETLRWIVYDVPAVVDAGNKILEQEPGRPLAFTTDFATASTANILLASGSLQFCEEPFADMLRQLTRLPDHILINKLACTWRDEFFTLQNMGPSIAPYKVVSRNTFLASLEALGYEIVDAWQNPELTCYIPFHPEHTVEAFEGFYCRRLVPENS